MNLEYVLVPDSKEVLKRNRNFKKVEGILKGLRSQPEKATNGQSRNNLNNKINNDSIGL